MVHVLLLRFIIIRNEGLKVFREHISLLLIIIIMNVDIYCLFTTIKVLWSAFYMNIFIQVSQQFPYYHPHSLGDGLYDLPKVTLRSEVRVGVQAQILLKPFERTTRHILSGKTGGKAFPLQLLLLTIGAS